MGKLLSIVLLFILLLFGEVQSQQIEPFDATPYPTATLQFTQVPYITQEPYPTATEYPTEVPKTGTPTIVPIENTSTATFTSIPELTFTATISNSTVPQVTPTFTPVATIFNTVTPVIPTDTPTIALPSETPTPVPSETETLEPSSTPTFENTATETATSTATFLPTETETPTETATPICIISGTNANVAKFYYINSGSHLDMNFFNKTDGYGMPWFSGFSTQYHSVSWVWTSPHSAIMDVWVLLPINQTSVTFSSYFDGNRRTGAYAGFTPETATRRYWNLLNAGSSTIDATNAPTLCGRRLVFIREYASDSFNHGGAGINPISGVTLYGDKPTATYP